MQTASLTTSFTQRNKRTKFSMVRPTDELELIHRITEGDDDAMRELYAQYGQRLYAFALRLTNDPATAEDVTQNTLVIAWQKATTFRGDSRLITWLLGIVHHTAMKAIRYQPHYLDETDEENIPQNQPSLEEQALGQEMKHWVKQGLQSLSSEHRAVLELVFYQGLSLQEVSQVLNVPLGTVKSRLSYARKHLGGALARSQENLP
jgi:RNA polymerase sigma-70 factor (ECF subfamily)